MLLRPAERTNFVEDFVILVHESLHISFALKHVIQFCIIILLRAKTYEFAIL